MEPSRKESDPSARPPGLLAVPRERMRTRHLELPWLNNVTRAGSAKRLPVVLTREEVRALLAQLQGAPWLIANLLYGGGLRLMEALRLRVKDLAVERGELIVRDGKGGKDRATMIPAVLETPLRAHLSRLRSWYEEERRRGQ